MESLIHSIQKYLNEIILMLTLAASVGFFGYLGYGLVQPTPDTITFSGEEALAHVKTQLDFGPRITGTEPHKAMGDWVIRGLSEGGWEVFIQPFEPLETVEARNILAVSGSGPEVIIGAHYDSRILADADPDSANHSKPVPGGNDGASGVAVLMELARSLNVAASGKTICLVFFDAKLHIAQHVELLLEHQPRRRGKLQLLQKAHPTFAKQIAANRQLQPVLSAQKSVDTIAQHRALPHEKAPLPKHLLTLASRLARDVDAADQVRPQQHREDACIDLIRLHLRLRDDARLERVSHHDVIRR